ncbi:MAG: hypothetical protein ACI9LX_003924 [Paraglaciecola sp.]
MICKDFKAEIIPIGLEKTPAIIIDDLAVNNKVVINYAYSKSKFTDDIATFYPSMRAPLPQPCVISILQAVYQGICQVYQVTIELNLVPLDNNYSMLTKTEGELELLQCMPHFDSSEPYHFAVLHY